MAQIKPVCYCQILQVRFFSFSSGSFFWVCLECRILFSWWMLWSIMHAALGEDLGNLLYLHTYASSWSVFCILIEVYVLTVTPCRGEEIYGGFSACASFGSVFSPYFPVSKFFYWFLLFFSTAVRWIFNSDIPALQWSSVSHQTSLWLLPIWCVR
jgi:hypothetical protein